VAYVSARDRCSAGRASSVGLALALLALPLGTSCFSRTNSAVSEAVYGSYDARQFSSSPVSTSLNGGKLGWQARGSTSRVAGFLEAGYLAGGAEGLDMFTFGGGARFAAFVRGRFELGGQGLLDFEHARLDRYRNANSLLALGIGGYAEVRIVARVSLTLTLAAHVFADLTAPTTCNDGSTSQSTGQGTCSHHGGIDFYHDKLGAGAGLDGLVGFRVWFGAGSEPATGASQ
jgi:hypothetical protein